MEGSYWVRLGAVLALFLGSLYILLPTILQEDAESRLQRQADTVDTPSSQGVDLDVVFDVRSGDPQAMAQVLSARLDQAGIPVGRIAIDGDQITVPMEPGASREQVIAMTTFPGEVRLVDPRLLPESEAELDDRGLWPNIADALRDAGIDARPFAGPLREGAGQPLADLEGEPLQPATLRRADDGGLFVQTEAALPEGWPFAVVLIDTVPQGLLIPTEGQDLRFEPYGGTNPEAVAALAAPPLHGELHPQEQQAEEAAPAPTDEAPVAKRRAPDWLLRMLPDTRINLGLDLQGGLDLTLQVGLDDAVLAQAARDATYARDQAERDGLNLISVRRERSAPIVWFETDHSLSELQRFLRQAMPDYGYLESEGNRHAFQLRSEREEEVRKQVVEQVLDTLRKRVDATGVKEPIIVQKGGGQINVQLPGEVDLQSAVDAIGTTAILEFRMVDEEADNSVLERILAAARDEMPEDQFLDDTLLNEWLWSTRRLDEDRLILWEYEELEDGEMVRTFPLQLKNEVVLTGNDVGNAGVAWNQNQQPYVSLEFKPRGARIFCDVTTANVGKRFAIILDGAIQSAPNIRERICGGAASIEMGSANNPMGEAQTLALVLRTGSLDAPVDLGGVRQIGATLGQDAIRQGSMAAVIGGLTVVLMLGVWYRWAGLMANIALGLNVMMVLAALSLFGATLTLPGIAGIALTVGMAVDSNIIIFERIREELKLGVQARKAVDVGFDKGVVAVLDANITSAIAGIVLFSYGTGPIKGFAVTLLIGIATTLVTALFVTRTLLDLSTRSSTARLKI